MQMLLEYLKERYRENEPIFVSDIELDVTDTNLRQMFKVLCDSGKIVRYDTGIYYMKGASRLSGGVSLSAAEVAKYKYIARNQHVDGYYSGFTFANQLGLTAQVPYTLEIVSNHASAKCREVHVKNQKIILRKPRTEVTDENYRELQLLDLLKDLDRYVDNDMAAAAERLIAYVRAFGIRQAQVDRYIDLFPDRVYRSIYETRLYDAFTP